MPKFQNSKIDMDMDSSRQTVLIIQRILPEYRIKFFSDLADQLNGHNIHLQVAYGQEYPGTVPRTQITNESWAHKIKNHYLGFLGKRLVWQSVLPKLFRADLIIIEQSNSLLINYIVLILRALHLKKVAYWGHGRNMQATTPNSISEQIKKRLIGSVDWWFAYTKNSVQLIVDTGFPLQKITDVQNAIDTSSFANALQKITDGQVNSIKQELNINSDNILLYCGGMYADKKIDFLLDACLYIKNHVSDLNVIFIGSGPNQNIVLEASNQYPWLHYIGPKFGNDRVVYFRISKALLMPGVVGLSIVDSFVSNIPLFTCDVIGHGPEIAYLSNNVNGVITKPVIEEYSEKLIEFLIKDELQKTLKKGCQDSAKIYTLDRMVINYCAGIVNCFKDS